MLMTELVPYKKGRDGRAVSLPCVNGARRWLFTSQEDGSHQTLNLQVPPEL